jgi:filamin
VNPGDWCNFMVNTMKAGPGALCVTVDGPSKVQLDCTQTKTGYQFAYCPTVAGVYLVSIKYAGSADIPGSPFRVTVKGMNSLNWLSMHG